MNQYVLVWIAAGVIGGLIAGSIVWNKTGRGADAFGFFLIGALFPLLGIILAAFQKAPPRPPGWYPDPWNGQMVRWYDGFQWTWHSQPMREAVR